MSQTSPGFTGFLASRLALFMALAVLVISGLTALQLVTGISNDKASHDHGNSLLYETLLAYGSSSVEPFMRDYTMNDSFCMNTRRNSWRYEGDPEWIGNLAECRDINSASDATFANEQDSMRAQVGVVQMIMAGMVIFLLWRARLAYASRNPFAPRHFLPHP